MHNFKISDELPYRAVRLTLTAGKKYSLSTVYPAIVFVTESNIIITMEGTLNEKEIPSGQLFLLPPDFLCTLYSGVDSDIIYLEIPDMAFLYMHIFSYPNKKPVDIQQLFSTLEIIGLIADLVNSISLYMIGKIDVPLLMGLKAMELFNLLKCYYTADKIHYFFSPILSDDYKFALFILTHYQKVSSSRELATLSNYSATHFDRLFRKIFKQPPYQWMLQKKINSIYAEIKNTSKPLKVIADQYGFASVANFGDFCRKHFGKPPSQLRNNIK